MATSNDLLIKQRSVNEFLAAEGYSAANIHARMKTVYGEIGISDCAVCKRYPECKAQSMEYRHKTSPSPRKFKVVASARKVLFTVFWDMEGVVHMEFLEQRQTVNSERYISTIRASGLSNSASDVFGRRDKDSILQHDNACPHTNRQTQLEFTTLQHSAYSPDLVPSDYYLFPQPEGPSLCQ
ncbi:histone-lysine N-methyltransferase SETMAR [Plakobranchus ocellatus]|uniref:Histone-lysine N-methyltransferase SETMAR n=1 Tax=Plakobranchus ocellatus TaxID=259542 RepID=A0AAV4CCY3_9GAST|nr:histone-lysine N-methyltransferase SETMAR [Plakobranchus ocellatus]